jgi:hypothetical protein
VRKLFAYLVLASVISLVAFVPVNLAQDPKVTICHFPPGNPANAQTITIGAAAVNAHVRLHGDTLGPCEDAPPPPPPP